MMGGNWRNLPMTEKGSRNRILMRLSVKSSELVCIFMEESLIFPRRQPEALKTNSARRKYRFDIPGNKKM
jgi:hypothetical protein